MTLVRTDDVVPVVLAPAGPADRDPLAVYLARLGAGSRRTIAAALELVARLLTDGRADATRLPWWELRYQHTQAVRAALLDAGYAPATVRKTFSALRGVLQESWRLGLLPADDYHRAVDLPTVPGERLPAGRGLAPGELRALFAVCDPSPSRALDAAVLAVLYGAGLRRAEAVAADLADYQSPTVPWSSGPRKAGGNGGCSSPAGPRPPSTPGSPSGAPSPARCSARSGRTASSPSVA